jgi:glutathione synthase/RimK-type ligase-like ATP-grasp enzyme
MSKNIILLLDYRDQFYFSTRYRGASVEVNRLRNYFNVHGFNLTTKHFYEIDLREENYKGEWIIYQSSEDPGLAYKDYIEDILLGLKMQGAHLIPNFKYFRSHHNKVFMEILRDMSGIREMQNIQSKVFGTYEEYVRSRYLDSNDSFVIKPGSGTRSRDVDLLKTHSDKKALPYNISRSFTFDNLKLFLSKIKTGKPFTPMSNNRKKFIVQDFIHGLDGDFRILAYGEKYYAVFRKNRKNNFTASGSGKLDFDAKIPRGLLDYAKTVYKKLDTPYASFDIGHKDGEFFLFEFQCLCLGQYTLEKSKFHYAQSLDGEWIKVQETPDLEREIAATVSSYIKDRICAE